MTEPTLPSRRAGLRDEIAAALEAADYRMDMRRGDLADAVLPVLYRAWPWMRAEAEDAAAPTVDRAAVSAALWAAAEHHTVAEWICCDPIDPAHALCVQGGAALRMLKALLVDDPDAWKPAPLLDTVMQIVPPAGSAAEAHRLALSQALDLGTGAPWDAIHERVGGLRRMADETQPAEAEAPYPPVTEWRTETQRRDDHWSPWCGGRYELAEARADFAETVANDQGRHAWRLVRATTTYTIEAERTPVVEARQDGAQTEAAVPVHACPEPGDNGISSCCGRPPCEFVGERVTRDAVNVTCKGSK